MLTALKAVYYRPASPQCVTSTAYDNKDFAIFTYGTTVRVHVNKDFAMLVSQTESNQFFGKMLIGRINSGKISVGDRIQAVDNMGKVVEASKIYKIIRRFGMNQVKLNN